MNAFKELRIADINTNVISDIKFNDYQLTGAQLFIKNFFNPNTLHKSLLINWQTGVGKSIAAITIGNEFIKQYQLRNTLGDKIPKMVTILGFNTTETIQADLIRYPELGYVTAQEVTELNRLALNDDPKYTQLVAMLHKRLTNKSLGGYYRFIGYREFVNLLFSITAQGIRNNITIQSLFEDRTNTDIDHIENLIKLEYITVNEDIMNKLRNGIVIADEIHNVYNSLEANNYGSVIKYVLHKLKDDAPRVVYMSATTITGNASEVIDLLNLLCPELTLSRSDYFFKNEEDIYELKPHTLNEIMQLTKGKVSYLLDTDKELYPTRIFVGEFIEDIPYIKLNVCTLPDLYQKAIDTELSKNRLIHIQVYTLYDIVFPNPDDNTMGLYENVIDIIKNAKQEWKREVGIDVYNNEDNITVITGSFLHKENLKQYSHKYYNVLTDVLDLIKKKEPGKIMIYHHKVQISGVLLIQEMFKVNGFIDNYTEPNMSTLCAICGIELGKHDDTTSDHIFKPCRFIMAHSKLNKSVMKKNIIKFNDSTNLYGHEYKLIIGSRVIREGLNFKAVRWQYIMSLPINFPILIQVLGRVVRKNSHIDLPKELQNVYIKIYANEIEVPRYKLKAKEYLIIQEVERALRINAIDNFLNYEKVQTNINSLESLQFVPTNIEKPPIVTKYFDAYDYNTEEVTLIKKLIYISFLNQTVWTYDDLWNQIHNIANVNYNLQLLDSTNFDIALYESEHVDNINNKYYIKSSHNTSPDIEYYFRSRSDRSMISFNLSNHFSKTVEDTIIRKQLDRLITVYMPNILELCLLDLTYDFHIYVLKKLILKEQVTNQDKTLINLYTRFKILIFNNNTPIGYLDKLVVTLYDTNTKTWYSDSLDSYQIDKRYTENSKIIGYTENGKFKLREPIKDIKVKDLRAYKKGAVCSTFLYHELINIVNEVRKINKNNKNYAVTYDKSIKNKKLSIDQICTIIKLYLLNFEELSRLPTSGMKEGIRWLYLFNDQLPHNNA